MFRKTLLTTTLAAALALSPVAPAPASADSDDLAKLLLGAVALGVAVQVIKNRREDNRQNNAPSGHAARPPHNTIDPGWARPPLWQATLPSHCKFEVREGHDWINVLGKRCLSREGIHVDYLPAQCQLEIGTPRGRRTVYGERCLQHNGYIIEAARR